MTGKFDNLFNLVTKYGKYVICPRGFFTNDRSGDPYEVLLADYLYVDLDDEVFCRVSNDGGGGFRLDEIVSMTPLKRGVAKYQKIFEDTLTRNEVPV